MKFKITNITGKPSNAVSALFDPEIPLWFRISMGLIGVLCWGTLILSLFVGKK